MIPPQTHLVNTPGTYYALAYWLSAALYAQMNPKRLRGWKRYGLMLGILPVVLAFSWLTFDPPLILFYPCLLTEQGMCFVILLLCCDIPTENKVYFFIRSLMLGEFAASLEWQLYYYGLNSAHMPDTLWTNILFLVFSHALVFGLAFLLERQYRKGNRRLQVTWRGVMTVAFIFVTVFAVSNVSYAVSNAPFSTALSGDLFIIRTITDLGGVGILHIYHVQLQELRARLELEQAYRTDAMQYKNYQFSEANIAMVNQKYHDLKHQLQLLRSEITSADKMQYLDQMEKEIRSFEAQNKTGNKVLDAILTGKSLECQRQNITLICMADGAALGFIEPPDLTSLFGNALDNAIEGVQGVADQERRIIHVTVARQKGFVRVKIRNCYDGAQLRLRDGLPVTTKRDKLYHGFGVRSIQSTVKKYGGSLSISTAGGWFDLNILFPEAKGPAVSQSAQ